MSDIEREAFERIERQFTSGNSVSVDCASVRKEDWEAAKKYAARQAPASGEVEKDEAITDFYANNRRSGYTHPPAKVPERLESLVREAEEACQDDGNQTMRESALAQKWLNSLNAAIALLTTPTTATTAGAECHEWNDVGERCLKCGDKDWFAGPVCQGRTPPQEQ